MTPGPAALEAERDAARAERDAARTERDAAAALPLDDGPRYALMTIWALPVLGAAADAAGRRPVVICCSLATACCLSAYAIPWGYASAARRGEAPGPRRRRRRL